MNENNEKESNIIFADDSEDDVVSYNDVSDKIFELRDKISLDIISKNVVDNFNACAVLESPNYVTKFKEKYYAAKKDGDEFDEKVLLESFYELSRLILDNLKNKFNVGIGDDLDTGYVVDYDEYIDRIETLYEFFVVRRYTYIKDYFKTKLLQNKISFVEKYKGLLDDKSYDDLFFNQDKKKYKDISDVIIIHFINDIIADIKETITGAYDFFKDIASSDIFELFNNNMYNLLIQYGNDFVIYDDKKAVTDYLSILDDSEVYINLRNDLLSMFISDASLNEKFIAD